jgi:hypothetical protein
MQDVAALESLVRARREYTPLPVDKPCIGVLLDGYLGDERHKAAFLLALEWRRLGVNQRDATRALKRWAKTIDYNAPRAAEKAVRSAYAKLPNGQWRYHPPGLKKKGISGYLLQPTCESVGCPQNCPAFSGVYGAGPEDYARFCRLGWPEFLRGKRRYAAIEVYQAVCRIEQDRNFRSGAELRVTHHQLAEAAAVDRKTVSRCLLLLAGEYSLITYEAGSGSGPNSKDRQASKVKRLLPVPSPPIAAITTGGVTPTYIGGITPGDGRHFSLVRSDAA